jgi:hypothetical protein
MIRSEEMRKVKVFTYKRKVEENKSYLEKVADGEAVFHQFGMAYDEFENGPGCFSTAIIEREDGTVENVPVEHIQFLDAEE